MNNERYNQIVDEAHRNYSMSCIKETKKQEREMKEKGGWNTLCLEPYFESKEKFIGLIKTDPEFSERWGLKIEERELSLGERYEIRCKKENIRNDWEQFYSTFGGYKNEMDSLKKSLNGNNIPTKLITVTYKGEKTEIYE